MSLGTSIFLSSLVLAFVALFIATKDRWSWKKIILWPLAGLILIASGLWAYSTIQGHPKVQTSFWDIPLGATEGDVRFLKGAPNVVPKSKDQDAWEYVFKTGPGYFVTNEKTGKKAWWDGKSLYPVDSSSETWDYIYRIRFMNGRVWLVEYFAPNRGHGPRIQGIDIGDPLEKIIQKFGSPSGFSAATDELSRVFSFAEYQVAFELKENRVVRYGVFDSKVAPKGVRYEVGR
jgi:outer membrane protein assembly factor BamE (lipoprotein component of BamABCDE complex)